MNQAQKMSQRRHVEIDLPKLSFCYCGPKLTTVEEILGEFLREIAESTNKTDEHPRPERTRLSSEATRLMESYPQVYSLQPITSPVHV